MAPLKSRDKNHLLDANKIFSVDLVEVSPSSSTINLAKNQKEVRNELKCIKKNDKEATYFVTWPSNALWLFY